MRNLLRNLFYACGIIAVLTATVHFAGRSAGAQTGGNPTITGFTTDGGWFYVITPGGDVYKEQIGGGDLSPHFVRNYWTGVGPTAVTPQTWSQIKGQYAPKTGGGN